MVVLSIESCESNSRKKIKKSDFRFENSFNIFDGNLRQLYSFRNIILGVIISRATRDSNVENKLLGN